MATPLFSPPYTALHAVQKTLNDQGYAILSPDSTAQLASSSLVDLVELTASWDDLRPDAYLKDGGRYRQRRHTCCILQADALQSVPHRAHWQPVEYNALHGGMQRWFEPVAQATAAHPAWGQLLRSLGIVFGNAAHMPSPEPWFIEAHQFRIDTTDGIGRPTPEGAHRDGVDFVAVLLVDRVGIKGGETRVFEAGGPNGQRFTMLEPWTLLLLDDTRVIHESTPIQPVVESGHRDTLVLTYRRGGFQGDG